MNVRFSPITILGIPYSRIAPVHMSHGDSVVAIVARRYFEAGRRPATSSAFVSPWWIALPFWIRRLCPAPTTWSSIRIAAPIGMPPSARPIRACSMATARSTASFIEPYGSAAGHRWGTDPTPPRPRITVGRRDALAAMAPRSDTCHLHRRGPVAMQMTGIADADGELEEDGNDGVVRSVRRLGIDSRGR